MSIRFARPSAATALAVLAVLLALVASPLRAEGPTEPLSIVSRGGRHAFQVEVMRDDAGRAQGLMFRRSMAPDHGMLFDFAQVAPVTMWMKNTYLPLDMLFIRADGTVTRIAADTEPLSTRTIPSGGPVLAVLELNAGTAAKLGIRTGDKIEHPLFKGR
ncbi:DUF192 domain-containing protein [Methylobacterium sp. ID0610]|uniref:DUF192 domain-containing protein n=1 Tax=Methylobacterium carpenticola TaxID=3344827 RepID=UPI0036C60B38